MTDKQDALLYEKDGHIVTLTMNQPELRNSMGDPAVLPLWQQAADRINAPAPPRSQAIRCCVPPARSGAHQYGTAPAHAQANGHGFPDQASVRDPPYCGYCRRWKNACLRLPELRSAHRDPH